MKSVAEAVAALDGSSIERLLSGASLEVAGETITIDDVIVTRSARDGTVVETDGALAVALDTHLDEALLGEGLAREIISSLQTLRKEGELDVADRILVEWASDDPAVREIMNQHSDLIAHEVLADVLVEADAPVAPFSLEGHLLRLQVSKR
jgi:isoleucyl-tRNA synthetase